MPDKKLPVASLRTSKKPERVVERGTYDISSPLFMVNSGAEVFGLYLYQKLSIGKLPLLRSKV